MRTEAVISPSVTALCAACSTATSRSRSLLERRFASEPVRSATSAGEARAPNVASSVARWSRAEPRLMPSRNRTLSCDKGSAPNSSMKFERSVLVRTDPRFDMRLSTSIEAAKSTVSDPRTSAPSRLTLLHTHFWSSRSRRNQAPFAFKSAIRLPSAPRCAKRAPMTSRASTTTRVNVIGTGNVRPLQSTLFAHQSAIETPLGASDTPPFPSSMSPNWSGVNGDPCREISVPDANPPFTYSIQSDTDRSAIPSVSSASVFGLNGCSAVASSGSGRDAFVASVPLRSTGSGPEWSPRPLWESSASVTAR